jgi:hypothetical protein
MDDIKNAIHFSEKLKESFKLEFDRLGEETNIEQILIPPN